MDRYPWDVPPEVDILGGEVINAVLTLNAPKGTLSTKVNDAYIAHGKRRRPSTARGLPTGPATTAPSMATAIRRWLISARRMPAKLKMLCSYDTGVHAAFETSDHGEGRADRDPEFDTFALDPPAPRSGVSMKRVSGEPAGCKPRRRVSGWRCSRFAGRPWVAYDFETGKSSGRRKSPMPPWERLFPPLRSPGTAWSGSARLAATTRA